MENHPFYGINAPEKGWVPAPSYLLRRNRVLNLLDPFPRGHMLEIGCGAGALLHDLSSMGFWVEALETSPTALDVAHYINRNNPHLTIHQNIQHNWNRTFDYILAFEVLEHIEDDLGALEQWSNWLKRRGRLLLSVPAHPERWSASDVWAGHYRRYERHSLNDVLRKAGFCIEHIECYGFPLANIIAPIRALHHAKQLRDRLYDGSFQKQRVGSDLSGISRSLEAKLYPLQTCWFGVKIMQFFCFLQDAFAGTDLGNGYLVLARR